MKGYSFLAILGLLVVAFVVSLITNFIAVWLWGIIAVGIFGLPALTFWQMFGLVWLVRLILPSHISYKDE